VIDLLYHGRLAAAAALGLPALLPAEVRPLWASLKLTGGCNSRCLTCEHWRSSGEDALSTARLKRLLGELRDLGVRHVRLTGGEPLLRRDLFEVLSSCGPDWFDGVTLATNGLLLARHADEINASPITRVTVSLDGIGPTNDRIRGRAGDWDTVVAALPSIRKPVKIVSIFTRELVPDLEGMLRFCEERGYGFDVNIPDAQPSFGSSAEAMEAVEALRPSAADVELGVRVLARHGVLPPFVLENLREFLLCRRFLFRHCVLGWLGVYVGSDGAVTPGCIASEPLGNVLETDLRTILSAPGYRAAAERMFRLDCPLCGCGYGASAAYCKPWRAAGYALRRLR
jgi:MoaA/NifB/PqqE/SkfB family radical SAM enzyme